MRPISLSLALALAAIPAPGLGQQFELELRGGRTAPLTQQLGTAELGGGMAMGGYVIARLIAPVQLVGGFSQDLFSCEPDCTLRGSGVSVAAQVGGRRPPLSAWAEAGILLHRLRLDERPPLAARYHFIEDTRPGFRLAGGTELDLTGTVTLRPVIAFTSYPITLHHVGADDQTVEVLERGMRFWTLQLAMRFRP